MEYGVHLVDDLLTDLEHYLWFCSLDAASGFWAVMMTLRARKISAFVCALGPLEWLHMPFGLKNARCSISGCSTTPCGDISNRSGDGVTTQNGCVMLSSNLLQSVALLTTCRKPSDGS
ncbi:hypothetical protein Pcac1_g18077 [Phytophthora cactorum]|nr:hypothetical protein Pcac1_g18077 [Phytophthora cactorum]